MRKHSPLSAGQSENKLGSEPNSGKIKGIRVLCGIVEESGPMTPGSVLSATLNSRIDPHTRHNPNTDVSGEGHINSPNKQPLERAVCNHLDAHSCFKLLTKQPKEDRDKESMGHNNLNVLVTYLVNVEKCCIENCIRTDENRLVITEVLPKRSFEINKSIIIGLLTAYMQSMEDPDKEDKELGAMCSAMENVINGVKGSNNIQEV